MVLGWLVGGWNAAADIRLLAAWRFETADFAGEDGTLPRSRGAAAWVEGASGKGVEFRPGSGPVIYPLASRGSKGQGQVNPLAMSLGLYYRPGWNPRGVGSGQGPGETARLVSIGDRAAKPADGWWELSVSADGTRLQIAWGSVGRDVFESSSGPIAFAEGMWSEIRVSVFPGRVRIHCDDLMVLADVPGKVSGPGPVAMRRGLVLGSAPGGGSSARGVLDEIEIHDAPLERVETLKRGRVMSAVAMTNGVGLELSWRCRPSAPMELERADAGSTNWSRLAARTGLMAYRDVSIEPGRLYQYRVLTNGQPSELTLSGGVRLPPWEDRGGVVLLVDQTLADRLAAELRGLERDLVADGWRVFRHRVPRHDDREWSANPPAIGAIRELVRRDWESSSKTLRCVYLIGHVAIPYSGMRAEDLHTRRGDNHWGAWPADQYYADMDGVWTDKLPYPDYLSLPTYRETRNIPGDGKFDTEWAGPNAAGETKIELGFGRLDFANLPAFGRGAAAEVELLRNYFAKAGRQRAGRLPARSRAIVGAYFESGTDYEMLPSAYRTGSHLFGYAAADLFQGDLFEIPPGDSAVWGFQGAAGHIDRVRNGSPTMVTSAQIASGERMPRVWFSMLMGSWFGDWALGENNLLRSIVASKEYGLAAFWVRKTEWRFDALARGGTLSDAQLETANEVLQWENINRGTTRTLTILGDPTLRLHPSAPPTNVQVRVLENGLRLGWQDGGGAVGRGWFVYRSASGPMGPFGRLTAVPLVAREFTDRDPPVNAAYLVKAVELVNTASGSYTNLSLGAAWPPVVGD